MCGTSNSPAGNGSADRPPGVFSPTTSPTCPSLPNSSSAACATTPAMAAVAATDFADSAADGRRRVPAPLNVVDIDDDHMWDNPWIYAVGVANWAFTDAEAERLRNFIARGGFLMVDHFHGQDDWNRFMSGMSMVLPGAVVEDIPDDDAIFHDLYDIREKFQIPGEQYVSTGRTYEKDGYIPGWRCIRDKDRRIVVAICFNMHLGDAWEWANTGDYPEKFSGLAFRIVLNYITYAMTH